MRWTSRFLALPMFLGCFAVVADGSAANAATVVFRTEGALTPLLDGWTFEPSDGSGFNPAEGYYPDKGGRLVGPLIPVEPNSYYRVTFTILAKERVYWGIDNHDADRKKRIADNYGSHFGYERQTLTRAIYTEDAVHFIQPFFQSPRGLEAWDMEIAKIDAAEALALHEKLIATVPPLDVKSVARIRPDRLPRTFEAMRAGTPWKVVMLGDSIINDTYNSVFMANMKALFPQINWKLICSVRGGTGCWYYREPEHFKAFVADYQPDLVIIGGISHNNDLEAVQSVVGQIRQGLPNTEILIMSGPVGIDWREPSKYDPHVGIPATAVPAPSEYYAGLAAYVEKEGLAFGDMERAWARYLAASQTPFMYLYRDGVHANEQGKAILGQIFAAQWAPE